MYAQAPPELLDACTDPQMLRVLLRLATFADVGTGKNAFPAVPTLAKKLGLSADTVRRHLHKAVDLKFLSMTERETKAGATASKSYDCLWYAPTLAPVLPSHACYPSTDATLAQTPVPPSHGCEPTLAPVQAYAPRTGASQPKSPLPKTLTDAPPIGDRDLFPEASKQKAEKPAAKAKPPAEPKPKAGEPPCTVAEAIAHGATIGLGAVDSEHFWHHHDTREWAVGKKPMTRWKSAMQTWRLQGKKFAAQHGASRTADTWRGEEYGEDKS